MNQTENKDDWHPIATAPKDGRVIELTSFFDDGEWFGEIWPMQWGHIQRNGLIPGKKGMWVTPDGAVTWDDSDPDGAPTHWRPESNKT